MVQPLEHDTTKIDRRLWTSLKRDLHDAPLNRSGFVVPRDVVPAHHVHYNLGAIVAGGCLGGCDKILGLVVNSDIGAELAARITLFWRARSCDHARAECHGKLDSRGTDARRAAVDQQSFAALESAS